MSYADYILPVLILCILGIALWQRLPTFDLFARGAKGGFSLCLDLLPYVCAILVAVELLRASGLADAGAELLRPVFSFFGIPPELAEFVVLRPFSGSGSIALFQGLVAEYGADAYVTRCAAVIMSASDTVFYIAAVYLASTKARKLRYAVPVALFATFLGVILSCALCRFL